MKLSVYHDKSRNLFNFTEKPLWRIGEGLDHVKVELTFKLPTDQPTVLCNRVRRNKPPMSVEGKNKPNMSKGAKSRTTPALSAGEWPRQPLAAEKPPAKKSTSETSLRQTEPPATETTSMPVSPTITYQRPRFEMTLTISPTAPPPKKMPRQVSPLAAEKRFILGDFWINEMKVLASYPPFCTLKKTKQRPPPGQQGMVYYADYLEGSEGLHVVSSKYWPCKTANYNVRLSQTSHHSQEDPLAIKRGQLPDYLAATAATSLSSRSTRNLLAAKSGIGLFSAFLDYYCNLDYTLQDYSRYSICL